MEHSGGIRPYLQTMSLYLRKTGMEARDFSRVRLHPTQPGDIWEFKKNIDGKEFYIKLKIQNRNGNDILKCLSFHEDDFG